MAHDRAALVRQGLQLNALTIAYNTVEAVVSLAAGFVAGSSALVSFGLDSAIELTASGAARWRLRADLDPGRRQGVEAATRRIVAWCFVVLAIYITVDSVTTLWQHDRPEPSTIGVAILALSVVVMPLLARGKRRVARALQSAALAKESRQTSLCAYLSAIALAGVALNALVGWWWADPTAALLMVPIIAMEGVDGLRRARSIPRRP